MKIYSQRDPRWKLKRLGFGTGTIGNFGCAMTCISMIWEIEPDIVDEWFKENDCFANLNLVYWANVPGFIWRGWSYDDAEVKDAISKYGCCIIETDFDNNPNNGKHFVLAIGNGRIYDPWDGQEKAFSSYKYFYGYVTYDPSKNPLKDTLNKTMKILTHMGVKTEEEGIAVWDKEMAFLKDARTKNEGLKEEIERIKAENAESYAQAELRKKELSKFKEDLAKKLFLPASSDQTDIISSVERLLTVEDQLTKANKTISQEQKKYEVEKSEMQKEIDVLKSEIEAERQKRDETEKKLLERIESLENRLNETESSSDATNQWKAFIDKLLSIFKGR